MATRTTVINDPVGIHARPAAQFSQAVTASGCTVTIAKAVSYTHLTLPTNSLV